MLLKKLHKSEKNMDEVSKGNPNAYVHLLRDPNGYSYICDECKLVTDDDLVPWEDFMNGCWTEDPPAEIGIYPIKFKTSSDSEYAEARQSKNNSKKFCWADSTKKRRIHKRWSMPLPYLLKD